MINAYLYYDYIVVRQRFISKNVNIFISILMLYTVLA